MQDILLHTSPSPPPNQLHITPLTRSYSAGMSPLSEFHKLCSYIILNNVKPRLFTVNSTLLKLGNSHPFYLAIKQFL